MKRKNSRKIIEFHALICCVRLSRRDPWDGKQTLHVDECISFI